MNIWLFRIVFCHIQMPHLRTQIVAQKSENLYIINRRLLEIKYLSKFSYVLYSQKVCNISLIFTFSEIQTKNNSLCKWFQSKTWRCLVCASNLVKCPTILLHLNSFWSWKIYLVHIFFEILSSSNLTLSLQGVLLNSKECSRVAQTNSFKLQNSFLMNLDIFHYNIVLKVFNSRGSIECILHNCIRYCFKFIVC